MTQKTALITGATGPLGSHIARALAQAGYFVFVNYRSNKSLAQKLAHKIHGRVVQADVTKQKDVAKLFKTTGPVDILINGVGDFIYKPLAKISNKEFHNILHSNLLSAWYCTKAVLPAMREKKFGIIINFGTAGCDKLSARPLTTPYYIAKTALLMLTRSLANEEKPNGIKLFCISLGVLPHGVRPPGAPLIEYNDISKGVLKLLKPKSKIKTGYNLKISKGWKPS